MFCVALLCLGPTGGIPLGDSFCFALLCFALHCCAWGLLGLQGRQASSLETWLAAKFSRLRMELWALLQTSAWGLLGLQGSSLETWRPGGCGLVDC